MLSLWRMQRVASATTDASAKSQRKSSFLPKDQLPEPLTAIVTDNPKRVIYWNHRYNTIPEINKEVRSVSLCDSRVYPSTKDQRISNPQSIRVRDHTLSFIPQ
jgi:hypothetical protein